MIDLPRITIVMPSFNQSRYIEESIQSILDQNYPNLEFLILDGGSTDGSQEIIQRYADHLTYWHSHSDTGQTDALIQGFSHATGELMGWLNSDDILLPGALDQIAQAYKSYPNGSIFGGNILVIDEQGIIFRCWRLPSTPSWLARYGWSVVAQPGSFFKRTGYEAVGGLHSDLHYIMDADLYIRMMRNNARYVKVNAWVAGFRLQALSKTSLHVSGFNLEYESARKKYLPWTKPVTGGRFIYLGMQVANGNLLRMLIDTWQTRGKHWRNWSANHLVLNHDLER